MSGVRKPSESGIRRAVTGPQAPAEPAVAAPPDADLDAAELADWKWRIAAKAGKAAAARARADAAAADWARLVAEARKAGVPAIVVAAAAADKGLEVPGGG